MAKATLIKEGEEPRVVEVDSAEAQAAFGAGFHLPEAEATKTVAPPLPPRRVASGFGADDTTNRFPLIH